MNPKWVKMYLDMAIRAAEESHAVRLKVGAIFVSVDGAMSMGINGLPEGGDNVCEEKEWCSAGGWLSPDEIFEAWPYTGFYKDKDGNEIKGGIVLKLVQMFLMLKKTATAKCYRLGFLQKVAHYS